MTRRAAKETRLGLKACPVQNEVFGAGSWSAYVVFFPSGSATVSAEISQGLEEEAARCALRGDAVVKGYASIRLSASVRTQLAEARARNVAAELMRLGCRSDQVAIHQSSRLPSEPGDFQNDALNDRAVVTSFVLGGG